MRVVSVCLLLVLLGTAAARGEEEPAETVPDPRGLVQEDALTTSLRYRLHDVTKVHVHAAKAWLHVWVTFREPLKDGMYEAVDLYLDCDGDAATGIAGADLYVRVSAGSRFRPNTEKEAPPGLLPAFKTRTAGWAEPRSLGRAGGEARVSWIWSGTEPVEPPRVRGNLYYFGVPLELIKEHGLRYNQRIGLRFEVESILAEQPIWLPYRCVDDGLAIRVDGRDEDWSGGPRAVDETDELHPACEWLDLESLQVEHGPGALFTRLRLAHPGFGPVSLPPEGDDIAVRDSITVAFEPLGDGHYMDYRQVNVSIHTPEASSPDTAWAAGDRVLETRIARPAAQTEFRVMAWSEAWRVDQVPDFGWMHYDIPSEAWNR